MDKIETASDLMIHIIGRLETLELEVLGEKQQLPPLVTEAAACGDTTCVLGS